MAHLELGFCLKGQLDKLGWASHGVFDASQIQELV